MVRIVENIKNCQNLSKIDKMSKSKHLKACLGPALVTVLHRERKVSTNRRNDKKCLQMGEHVFSHF